MNSQRLRSMFSRQNVVPAVVFFLLVVVIVCGFAASAWRSSAEASVGNGRGNQSGNQRPPEFANRTIEDVKKDFNDDDLKVKGEKPRGKWSFATLIDTGQLKDSSVPVAVLGVQSLSGGGKYLGITKIKRTEITNRSPKIVNSVQLRWVVASLDDPTKVLSEGATQFVNTWIEANNTRVIEIPTLHPALLLKPLAKDGLLAGRFQITISMQEARFADGSFWTR